MQQRYATKCLSAEAAARLVKSGDWVDYGFGLGMPYTLDKALAARRDELTDVKIRGIMALRPLAVVEHDPEQQAFSYMSWHMSSLERHMAERGLCSYIPMSYRNKPEIYRKCLTVDVAFVSVTPMDAHGYFNFSLTNSATMAILETAKLVVLEVNECLPRTYGGFEECIHLSDVDYIVEGEPVAPQELPSVPFGDVERAIAAQIVEQVRDGSTIQLGIGALPNAVGAMLAETDLRDLGMHTEMLVDAYLKLWKSGTLTHKKKNTDRGKGVWSFCGGSAELYEWVRENPGLASCPVNYSNSPEIMGRNDQLVTINSCLEADIFGQISSESTSQRQISGTGGQLDFVSGSFISNGGKSFLCLTSTFTDKHSGERRSRIVPALPEGTAVTAPRSQIHQIITEWGCVNLAGRSLWERAEAIVSIAHPDFRDDLIREAERMGVWRKRNKKL